MKTLLLAIVFFAVSFKLSAGPLAVGFSFAPAAPLTGSVSSGKLEVLLPSGEELVSLATNRLSHDLLVTMDGPTTEKDGAGRTRHSWRVRIQVFELEEARFPGFLLLTRDAQGNVQERSIAAFRMPIKGVPVDLERQPPIRGPRGPLDDDRDGFPVWPAGLAILGLLALAVFLLRRRRRAAGGGGLLVPGEDPWVTVQRRLQQMMDGTPADSEAEKETYFTATELVRFLLGSRSGLPFPEATTSEVALLMEHVDWLDQEAVANLIKLFQQGDLVKFAKFRPAPGDRLLYLNELLQWCAGSEEKRLAFLDSRREEDPDGI